MQPVVSDQVHLVGEKDEVSIKLVADAIVKAVGFEGEYKVCRPPLEAAHCQH